MRLPIDVPGLEGDSFNPANPPFTVTNDAALFDPFDPEALGWVPGTSSPDEAPLSKFGLELTYTVRDGETAALWAPADGNVWFRVQGDGAQRQLTLILDLDDKAIDQLHMGGRVQDMPLPNVVSTLPWGGVGVLEARLEFTFEQPSVQDKLWSQLTALLAEERLTRPALPETDVQTGQGGAQLHVSDPAPSPAERMLTWFQGNSDVPWVLKRGGASSPPPKLVELSGEETVRIQAVVKGGRRGPSQDANEYFCNVGFLFRALGVAGDPADAQHDLKYQALSGECVRLISSGGRPSSFQEVVVIDGGSRDEVLLQPPAEGVTAGAVFSFSSADDIRVFSPRLGGQPLGARLWQPTLTRAELLVIRQLQPVPSQVYLPPQEDTVFLVSEYGRKTSVEVTKEISRFHTNIGKFHGYDGRRARPAASEPAHVLPAEPGWTRSLNLNEQAAIRPEHPAWRRGKQIKRLYPLRLELRLDAEGPVLCTLSQDDVDCIRQEYIFHLKWSDDDVYFQSYAGFEDLVAWFSGAPRPTSDAQGHPLPALRASGGRFTVPRREEIRPLGEPNAARDKSVYRHTMLSYEAQNWKDKVAERARHWARKVTLVLEALDSGSPLPSDTGLPAHAIWVISKVHALMQPIVSVPNQSPIDAWFQLQLEGCGGIERFRRQGDFSQPGSLKLVYSSGWRPPEHNECYSKHPNSNHQLGMTLDIQPAESNPLTLLCEHLASQDLYKQHGIFECMIEQGSTELFSRVIDDSLREAEVRDVASPGQEPRYKLFLADGSVKDPKSVYMYPNVPERFRQFCIGSFDSSLQWPINPSPTYQLLYLFALVDASHVHHAFKV
jgi:hypothetical protein